LADELVGGDSSAGPNRLEAASKRGIQQVVAPGALDMVNFVRPKSAVPQKFRHRKLYQHNPMTTLMRTTKEENRKLGATIGDKLNKAIGRATVLVPLQGFSDYDKKGGVFYDPDADRAFVEGLRMTLVNRNVVVEELNCHINDSAFAERAVSALFQMM